MNIKQLSSFTVRHPTPVLLLYSTSRGGGPGGGCEEKDRGFFNPNKYKVGCALADNLRYPLMQRAAVHFQVIFLDQRGSGKSTPCVDNCDSYPT